MSRKARCYSKSNYYHAIVQGINKEYIFNSEKNIKKYLFIISKKMLEEKIVLLAYCIMSNHAHFLIYSERVEYLSSFMKKINTTFSIYYNYEQHREGYVFKDRFYSQDILNQNQLLYCMRYIHNNPVKAGMVKEMKDYRFSSYNEYLGKKNYDT